MLLSPPPGVVRGSLNLGGISNVTVLEQGKDPIAFDIGPANALIDAAVEWATGGSQHFDRDGRRGAAGGVVPWLLESLLAEPYYALPPPKSTGKELFHLEYLQGHLAGRTVASDDLVATLTALSAETVAAALRQCGVAEVIAAGGGTRNPVLMAAIAERLPGVAIGTIDAFGVAEAAKEGLLMALIAFLSVNGLPATVPSCTGARHASVLGSLAPGRAPLVLPPPAAAPSRLVVRTPLPGTGDGHIAGVLPPPAGGRPVS
jgi:anhydro-N-acetylmuramic acid kinase